MWPNKITHPRSLFASLPTTAVEGTEYFVSDVGDGGSFWRYDGATWRPFNGSVTLYNNATAYSYICPAATFTGLSYANNGGSVQFSSAGVHSLTTSPAVGASVYVTWAGGTGVNGFYQVLSVDSATAFTVQLAYAVGLGTPTVAVANTELTLPVSVAVKGNALGTTGELRIRAYSYGSNTANSKNYKAYLGNTNVAAVTMSANSCARLDAAVQNKGAANAQFGSGWSNVTYIPGPYQSLSVDTTTDKAVTLSVQAVAANDVIGFSAIRVELCRP